MRIDLIDLIVAPCVRSPWAPVPFLAAPDHRVDLAPAPYGAAPAGIEHYGRSVGDAPAPVKRRRARKAARKDGVTPAMVDGLAFLRRANRMLSRWVGDDGDHRAVVWGRWLTGSPGHRCFKGADGWGPADGCVEYRRPRRQDRSATRLWHGLMAVAIRACRAETDAAEAVGIAWERMATGGRLAYPISFVSACAKRHERTRERRAAARRAAKDAVAAGFIAAASDPRHAIMVADAEARLGDLLRAYALAKEQGQEEPMRTVERKRARLLSDLERKARAILANSAV